MKISSPSSPSDENPRDSRALARFAAVQIVEQAIQNGVALVQAAQQASQQPWDGRFFSAATIEDWYYKHKRGKFAALQDQPRSDRGTHKALDPAAVEALLKLRREHPKLTVRALTLQLVRLGVLQLGTFSESTILRRLAEAGLDRQSLRAGSGLIGGPTKAFELPLPNLLWMTDCMYGPTLQLADGQSQRTFLFALIDDCTRLLIHGQFYPQERVECFLDTLRQAVQTRGLPDNVIPTMARVSKASTSQSSARTSASGSSTANLTTPGRREKSSAGSKAASRSSCRSSGSSPCTRSKS